MNEKELMALDEQAFVEAAYTWALGRPADPQGLLACLARMQAGTPRRAVLAELEHSAEGRAFGLRQGRVSAAGSSVADLLALAEDPQFLDAAYLALLGRKPDDAERARNLGGSTSRHEFLTALRRSAEARLHACTLEDVHTLDLEPDELADPSTLGLDRLLGVSDEAFVHLAYRRMLGRDADPTGRSNYLALLRRGADRAVILHELQQSPEGRRHGAQLAGLDGAVARARSWRRRLRRLVRGMQRRAGNGAAGAAPAPAAPGPLASLSTPSGPTPLPAQWTGLRPRPRPPSPLSATTARLAQQIKSPATSAPGDRATLPSEPMPMTDPNTPQDDAPPAEAAAPIAIERFIGPIARGWAAHEGKGAACALSFGGRILGSLTGQRPRPDIQASLGLTSAKVGFDALLGGLLQFSALVPGCGHVELSRVGASAPDASLELQPQLAEALAFSPLKAFTRLPPERQLGRLLSIDFLDGNQLAVLFEAASTGPAEMTEFVLDAYQACDGAGTVLERLARFSVAIAGEIVSLEVPLRSRSAPVLFVVTDVHRGIILTDCLPLPELHAENQKPLLEYHSLLTGGQPAFDVATKIGRSHLDAAVRRALGQTPPPGPTRDNTALLLYSRENHDFLGDAELDAVRDLAQHSAVLRHDGLMVSRDGATSTVDEFLSHRTIEHVLLLDVRCAPRPDFWSAMAQNLFRLQADTELVHWHSIYLEGMNRPFVAKPGLLLHPTFVGHETLPLRAALLCRARFDALRREDPAAFRSGALRLEQVLATTHDLKTACIPLIMDAVTWPTAPPAVATLARAEHVPLPALREPSPGSGASGVSVIINYRNSPEDTLQCLRSLAAQDMSLPVEVILVNNLSTPENVELVTARARELFGETGVQTVDYPYDFNHSAQCNIAAKVARHDLLLMLSNDSLLLSPRALAHACAVATVPWVGTVGFRIIGHSATKAKLQSLGLGLSPRQMLFHGGSPLSTHRPPAFMLEHTQETLGNTFAAVVLRRQSYLELGGLDEVAFPTNYNDVDYCCRALQQGLRHVTIGAAVVQHVGRGSREMDLDLPIDQRIVERCPDFTRLTTVGIAQL